MPNFDEPVSDSVELTETLTMEVIGFVPIFGSIEGADRYFSERLYGQAWEVASAIDKRKALITATRAINNLRFAGSKTDDTQPLEYPRNGDATLPECLLQATYEEALALLKGIDPDTERANLTVTSRVFVRVRTDYDVRTAPQHIMSGIASSRAWNLLQPLRDPALELNLRRRS